MSEFANMISGLQNAENPDPQLFSGFFLKINSHPLSGWRGPYLVIGTISDLAYQIQASKLFSKPKVVHLDHLKPYYTNVH